MCVCVLTAAWMVWIFSGYRLEEAPKAWGLLLNKNIHVHKVI